MTIRSYFLFWIITLVVILTANHESSAQTTIRFSCPSSINVGIKAVPSGWSDFLSTRNHPLIGASVDIAGRQMGCDYGGFAMYRQFPKGHTCAAVMQPPRAIECTPVKPPIKIPGKKGTN